MNIRFSGITWGFPDIDRRLLKVQFSFLLMVLGGRCNQLAVAWWTLQETGSALYFANMIACAIAVEVLAKPLLGWLGDKYNKILIIKRAAWINLLTALLMVLLSATGSFNPWAVGSLMMISSAIVGVRDPLQASIIPLFADDDKVSLAFRTKSVMRRFSIPAGTSTGQRVDLWVRYHARLCYGFFCDAHRRGIDRDHPEPNRRHQPKRKGPEYQRLRHDLFRL